MSTILSFTGFLSGCFPIAIIHFIVNYYSYEWTVSLFTRSFLFITVVSCVWFVISLISLDRPNNENATMSKVRRKDIFISGAISYYVLPFISFVASGEVGVIILMTLIPLFLKIFHNNRMFLYTPVIDILGYKILECELSVYGQKINANVIVGNGKKIDFTGNNQTKVYKIDEGIYFAKIL